MRRPPIGPYSPEVDAPPRFPTGLPHDGRQPLRRPTGWRRPTGSADCSPYDLAWRPTMATCWATFGAVTGRPRRKGQLSGGVVPGQVCEPSRWESHRSVYCLSGSKREMVHVAIPTGHCPTAQHKEAPAPHCRDEHRRNSLPCHGYLATPRPGRVEIFRQVARRSPASGVRSRGLCSPLRSPGVGAAQRPRPACPHRHRWRRSGRPGGSPYRGVAMTRSHQRRTVVGGDGPSTARPEGGERLHGEVDDPRAQAGVGGGHTGPGDGEERNGRQACPQSDGRSPRPKAGPSSPRRAGRRRPVRMGL